MFGCLEHPESRQFHLVSAGADGCSFVLGHVVLGVLLSARPWELGSIGFHHGSCKEVVGNIDA